MRHLPAARSTAVRLLAGLPVLLMIAACSSSTSPTDQDLTPPAAIDDLRVTGFTATTVTLAWTATGDDGDAGQANRYELRRSDTLLIPSNWETGTVVPGMPAPAPAGSTQTFTVTGLTPEAHYYFAISAWDDAGNTFGVSNCVDATCFDNTVVLFADPALEGAVLRRLGLSTGPLHQEDMRRLVDLDAQNLGIASLQGLDQAPNLEVLHLSENSIDDLTPLRFLFSLRVLGLNTNDVGDLTPLAGLTHLQQLWLDNNRVASLAGLAQLDSLQTLRAEGNVIDDLTPLAGITSLQHLYLSHNSLGTAGPLSTLTNLQDLTLADNQVIDLEPLSGLTQLQSLDLANNQINDISPLAGLTSLQSLRLSNNQFGDISFLEGMTALQTLDVGGNDIQLITPLDKLTALQDVYLDANRITDLTALTNLPDLAIVQIQYNQVTDLAPLVANLGLGAGDQLDASHNPLSSDAINVQIPTLEARGVTVTHTP